jgi:hypothetical protein
MFFFNDLGKLVMNYENSKNSGEGKLKSPFNALNKFSFLNGFILFKT